MGIQDLIKQLNEAAFNQYTPPMVDWQKHQAREGDCPAAPVCDAIGNLRDGCKAGSTDFRTNMSVCVISLILLISRLGGMWPKEALEELEKRRIGFATDEPGASPRSEQES